MDDETPNPTKHAAVVRAMFLLVPNRCPKHTHAGKQPQIPNHPPQLKKVTATTHVHRRRFKAEEGEARLPCYCGAPNCNGFLN